MSISTEEKKRYFSETALVLNQEGFHVEKILGGKLGVWLDNQTLCEVSEIGGITYRSDNISTQERLAAKDRAYQIVCSTAEYMRQMEHAPSLKASDLQDTYKVLADFNGTVLAAKHGKFGVQFVTWDWDYDRKGVSHGHYFTGNYEGAKQDFAVRSGLVKETHLLTNEQLSEVYRCIHETLNSEYSLSDKRHEALLKLSEQIERGVSNLEELVYESNKQELDLTM